jgi:hypothetical protein
MDVRSDSHAQRRTRRVVDLSDLGTRLSRSAVDSEQVAYVTYHVGVPTRRQASAVRHKAQEAGWRVTFYVDPAQWVVRLVKSTAPTTAFVDEAEHYVGQLAARHRGRLLAVTVEEPLRDLSWELLADRVAGPAEHQGSAPVTEPAPDAARAGRMRTSSGA